jgi:lipopolysaccharide/colanic/teichoic acid biosynthesis glycosyltransferase
VNPEGKSLIQLYGHILVGNLTMALLLVIGFIVFKQPSITHLMALVTWSVAFGLELLNATYVYAKLSYRKTTGKRVLSFIPTLYPDVVDPNQEQNDRVKPKEPPHPEKISFKPFEPMAEEERSAKKLLIKRLTSQSLADFVLRELPVSRIDKKRTQVLNTRTLFNLQTVKPESLQLFVNLHRLNDVRRINEFIIQVNQNLVPGGYYVGCAFTQEARKEQFMRKFRGITGRILYFFDFILVRVLPKLPLFKELFFFFTQGENRILSRTEVLGRLYFCGYELIESNKIDNYFYFIVRKVKQPRQDTDPSYGPFIKMKRVVKNGAIINVYKFRTMHPYSEYLQDYVYEVNALDETGKFKDDFRITTWGKIFRKFWIDELPQLLNLYRGQLKIFGVRALSRHYYSLYPKSLQELRIKTKPGLIPPYYVDRPQTFDEICESERKYLEAYQKNPFRTDWNYFWKAVFNIVINKSRSK